MSSNTSITRRKQQIDYKKVTGTKTVLNLIIVILLAGSKLQLYS
jgi:hypothetical protein